MSPQQDSANPFVFQPVVVPPSAVRAPLGLGKSTGARSTSAEHAPSTIQEPRAASIASVTPRRRSAATPAPQSLPPSSSVRHPSACNRPTSGSAQAFERLDYGNRDTCVKPQRASAQQDSTQPISTQQLSIQSVVQTVPARVSATSKLAGFTTKRLNGSIDRARLAPTDAAALRPLDAHDMFAAARSLLEEAAHELLAPLAVARQLMGEVCQPTVMRGRGRASHNSGATAIEAATDSSPATALRQQQLLQMAQGRMEQAALWAENILASKRLSDLRPLGVRQRFYPEQWRRRAQPLIDRIAASHGVQVQWTGWERSLPLLYLPSDHLTRVITNLVVNAAAASPKGQTVYVRVAWQTSLTQALVIAVEDNGRGASDELLDFLNSPSPALFQHRRGIRNGIGLQTVKSLVHAMGGTIFARRASDSDPSSSGTIIRIAIPVDDRPSLIRSWLDQRLNEYRMSGLAEASKSGFAPRGEDHFSQSQHTGPSSHGAANFVARGAREARKALRPVQLTLIGYQPTSPADSFSSANMALHEIAEPEDFVYRVGPARWLWLSTRESLPLELELPPWQTAIAARWSWPQNLLDEQSTSTAHAQQPGALTRFARSIAETLDRYMGKRVPELDELSNEPSATKLLRADGAHALVHSNRLPTLAAMPAHNLPNPTAKSTDTKHAVRPPFIRRNSQAQPTLGANH